MLKRQSISLLIEVQCVYDKGELSIVKAFVDNVKKVFPDIEIYICSPDPLRDIEYEHYGILRKSMVSIFSEHKPFHWRIAMILFVTLWSFLKRLKILNQVPRSLCEYCEPYDKTEVVIINSGDIISSLYGRSVFWYFYLILISKILRKKVYIIGQTIGPFQRFDLFFIKYLLNFVDVITVRGKRSYFYLKHDLKVSKPKIHIAADPAFLLYSFKSRRAEALEYVIVAETKKKKPIIGIALSAMIYKYIKDTIKETELLRKYLKILIDTCNELIEKFNAFIVLLPHHYGPKGDDDRILGRLLIRHVPKLKDNSLLITEDLDPSEIKYIISLLDVLIAFRMHPLIHAISSLVPSIGIEYNHKVLELMSEFDLHDLCLPIHDLSPSSLIRKVEKAIREKEVIKELLRKKIVVFTNLAMTNVNVIKPLMIME